MQRSEKNTERQNLFANICNRNAKMRKLLHVSHESARIFFSQRRKGRKPCLQWAMSREQWAESCLKNPQSSLLKAQSRNEKIRVNTRDTWKLFAILRPLRENSSFELLSFLNVRIREFVGGCGFAVKDAIYWEFSRKLKVKVLENFVLILDNSDAVSLSSDGVWAFSNGVQNFSNGVWENSNGVWIFKNPIFDLPNAFSMFLNAFSAQKHAT